MNFAEFMAAYDDLIARARDNKLAGCRFRRHHDFADQSWDRGDHGIEPAADAGAGRDHRHGRDRLSAGISRRAGRRARVDGTEQSDDGDLHLRSSRDSGRRIGHVPGAPASAARRRGRISTTSIFRDLGISMQPMRWEPDQAAAPLINADPVKQSAVARLIQAWRERGHLVADLDPLGRTRPPQPDLEPSAHGLTIWDLDRTLPRRIVRCHDAARRWSSGCARFTRERWACSTCTSTVRRRAELAPAAHRESGDARRGDAARILRNIIEAEGFELFLDHRFKGHKRFSLEGGEAMIAMFDELLDRAAAAGVSGMRHRDVAPRAVEHAGEHRREKHGAAFFGIRRRRRSGIVRRPGRRQISPGRDGSAADVDGQRHHGDGGVQSESSRSGESGGRRADAAEAGPAGRPGTRTRGPAADSRRRGDGGTGRGRPRP